MSKNRCPDHMHRGSYQSRHAVIVTHLAPTALQYNRARPFLSPNDRRGRTIALNIVRPGTGLDLDEANWMQTRPGEGWFVYLRLYGPEKLSLANSNFKPVPGEGTANLTDRNW